MKLDIDPAKVPRWNVKPLPKRSTAPKDGAQPFAAGGVDSWGESQERDRDDDAA